MIVCLFFFFKQKTAYEICLLSRGLGLPVLQGDEQARAHRRQRIVLLRGRGHRLQHEEPDGRERVGHRAQAAQVYKCVGPRGKPVVMDRT